MNTETPRSSGRPSHVLIVDDDPLIADAIVAMLERDGRTLVVCHDLPTAEIALNEFEFTHVVSDLQLSNSVPFEGVRFVDSVRRLQPDTRIVVVSGYASPIVKSAALASGADAFLAKPFDGEAIESALGDPATMEGDPSSPARLFQVQGLDALLQSGAIHAHFQPIVALDTFEVHGFEALARISSGWPFADVRTLFDYAGRTRRVTDLNKFCIEQSLKGGASLAGESRLFVNVDPVVVSAAGFARMLRRMAEVASIPLDRIVIELTENAVSYDADAAIAAIDELHEAGVLFAIDDAESAPANLPLIERIRPAYLKLSHGLGSSFVTDRKKAQIVSSMSAFARDLSCSLILEGIETGEAAERARDMGIPFAQGFWFAKAMDATAAAAYRQGASKS